jgi:hypothetical protein
VEIGGGTGGGSSQTYSGSISAEGDYRINYSVSTGPTAGCLFGW